MTLLVFFFTLFLSLTPPAAHTTPEWHTDYNTALHAAQQQNRPILMVFSGSDWCKPCIILKKKVLSSPEFLHYASDNLILLYVDFPRYKKNKPSDSIMAQNAALAEKYNPEGGFPYTVIINSMEEVIAATEFSTSLPDAYIQHIKELTSSH
ncbi:MAG: thioredoxin family protein [Bacteroidia bacterium]